MVKNPTKTVRRVPRGTSKKPNKASMLRAMFEKTPGINLTKAKERFEKSGMTLSSAQFYSIRAKCVQPKKKSRSTKQPVMSAKCAVTPEVAANVYRDPALMQDSNTAPPTLPAILQARKLLEAAYLQAWNLVGLKYDLVDMIVDDIQEQHSN